MDGKHKTQELDFPIQFLHRAYNILEGQGHGAFRNYANRVEMPVEDIERVLNKYNYRHNPEFKEKINKITQKIKIKLGIDLSKNI